MLVHTGDAPTAERAAGRLHHEYIRPAHVFLDLDVALAVGKARDLRLPTQHPEKVADFIRQGLVCSTAENLELLIGPRPGLALGLLFRHWRTLLLNFFSLVGRRN